MEGAKEQQRGGKERKGGRENLEANIKELNKKGKDEKEKCPLEILKYQNILNFLKLWIIIALT